MSPTDRIPLSELREWLGHLEIRPWFAEATRRQRLEAAVLCAKGERDQAEEYHRLLAAGAFDPAPVAVQTDSRPPSEGGLPW